MEQRRLGDRSVSAIGLGTMSFGGIFGAVGRVEIRNLPIAKMLRRPGARNRDDVVALRENPCKRRTRNGPAPFGAKGAEGRDGREVCREVRLGEARIAVAEIDARAEVPRQGLAPEHPPPERREGDEGYPQFLAGPDQAKLGQARPQ